MLHVRNLAQQVAGSRQRIVSLLLTIAACCHFLGCSSDPKAQNPPPAARSQTSQSQKTDGPPPPKPSEIEEVIQRVFKDAAVIDPSRSPNSVVGDFNGDLSQDIAVILKPAPGKIRKMNEPFPPWILRDPFVAVAPGMEPLRIRDGEVLLAVIHGYDAAGWRAREATQTYVLKNAIGEGFEARTKADILAASNGKKLPQLRGDLISEVLGGRSGYLYYSGSTYSWYDPATFVGEPAARTIHPGMGTGKQD